MTDLVHRSSYDRIAARFARTNAAMPPSVLAAARRLLALVGRDSRLLDLGCGHGRDAAWFEARGVAVLAGDLSTHMLVETKRLTALPAVQLTMLQLPFADASLGCVWCNAAILHLPKRQAPTALREIRRVLQAGGLVFLSVQVGRGETWELESYGLLARRFFARYRPEEFARLMVAAGFGMLSVEQFSDGPDRHWAHYFARRL